ncbi:zona pellucida-binding protein 2 isoform X2 [Candoia aspera]|uniref:zona pellucida-binding protein 2 isoform X2 n=1 Tax=Candoia aspera TaxID=51853 RepID=UPI002FD827A7
MATSIIKLWKMPVSSSSTVNVYVRVHRNSPYLVCMDLSLSQSEVIDPNYLWVGPNGQTLKRKSYVNLTETGKLMLLGFKEHMSGSYTCTLSYRVFQNDMQAEEERFKTYKFMVYAYREPDYTYRISVHFTTKECKLTANGQFFEELKKILNNLLAYLKCHIVNPSYRCFSVKRPKHGLVDELFVVFQDPFAPGWEVICRQITSDCEDVTNNHVQKARGLIEEFFHKQQYILKHEFVNIPAIHYIDHSFQVTRLDSCRPGFGKNDFTHNDCANCCGIRKQWQTTSEKPCQENCRGLSRQSLGISNDSKANTHKKLPVTLGVTAPTMT